MKRLFLILITLLVLLWSIVSCAPSSATAPNKQQSIFNNPRYIYQDGAVHVGADGEPIELINNPDAINPSYAELVAFIKDDLTDSKVYSKGNELLGGIIKARVCADFAEEVHNNAEAKGFRAAWVSIDFVKGGEGHAINAFETTDRGLVYIDSTGASFSERLPQLSIELSNQTTSPEPISRDSMAYVEISKEYGSISVDKASSPSYSFYEEYKRKWQSQRDLISEYNVEITQYNQESEAWQVVLEEKRQMMDKAENEYERHLSDYNSEIAQYNQEIKTKVYQEGSSELAAIEAWQVGLEEKRHVTDRIYKEYKKLLDDYNNNVALSNHDLKAWQVKLKKKRQVIDELTNKLGESWSEPLGIVEDIFIRW